MAKKWKQILAAGLTTGLLMASSSQSVFAQSDSLIDAILDEEEGADEITSEETTEDFAEDTSYSLLRGTNLNLGSMKIKKLASNEIGIYGLTQCHKKCSKVYLSIYLERKVNGSYGTYKYWNFTANNVTSLSKTLDVAVPSGTYYRVRGYHAASNGGLKESTSTLTSGIMVK
ncbi:DUF6147 family protein [Blautia sp. MSK17_66]|uniref:DUF6147 family protein n=1 Tax=Blautia TaxID=572511 RepID=UPI001FC7BCF4|nr:MULTISPECIES: DUF6147 family protein [Blautia]MCB5549637.1 DUF6147 family protein [Blautia sp. MSK17_66]